MWQECQRPLRLFSSMVLKKNTYLAGMVRPIGVYGDIDAESLLGKRCLQCRLGCLMSRLPSEWGSR